MLESGEYVEEGVVAGARQPVKTDRELAYQRVQNEQIIAESQKITADFKAFSAKYGLF